MDNECQKSSNRGWAPKRSLLLLSVSALMLALMVAFAGGASADTYVEDNIDAPDVWDETGSPYYVNETIYVAEGATLTIEANVTVLFGPGAGIVVNGSLFVEGNATHPVVLDAIQIDGVEGEVWWGLTFNDGSCGDIDNALINNTLAAIDVINAEVTITDSQIINTGSVYAPVFAVFTEGGSLVIDGCYIEAQSALEVPIYIVIEAYAEGTDENVTEAEVAITNNVVNSTSSEGLLYIERRAHALENGIATVVSDIVVSGNEFNLLYSDGNLAHFVTDVLSEDEGCATIDGNVTIADNVLYTTSTNGNGVVYFERYVNGHDESVASLVGNILISGNTLNMTSIDSDAFFMDTEVYAYGNATAEIVGDFTFVDNVMPQTGNYACYLSTEVWAGEGNSTARLIGDVVISDNVMKDFIYGPYIYYWLEADGYGAVALMGDILMNGNVIDNAYSTGVYYICDVVAVDNAIVSVANDVHIDDNIIGYTDDAFTARWETYSIQGNASVDITASLCIEGNRVVETDTAFDLGGSAFDSWWDSNDFVASGDAVVALQVDVVVLNNVIDECEQDGLDAYFMTNTYAIDRSCVSIDGSLLFEGNQLNCTNEWAVYVERYAFAQDQAEVAINVEVSILGNTIFLEGVESYIWNNIVISLWDDVEADDEAVATLCGDVTITDNTILTGYAGDAVYLNRDVNAEGNASATLDSDVLISCNVFDPDYYQTDYIRAYIYVGADDNATAQIIGALVAEDNEMLSRGSDTFYLSFYVWAGGENSTARLVGDLGFCNNYLEDVCCGPDIYYGSIEAEGYAEVLIDQDFCMCGNVIDYSDYPLGYYVEIEGDDFAEVSFLGNVCVCDNDYGYSDTYLVDYDFDIGASEESIILVESALTVTGNSAEYVYEEVIYYYVSMVTYDLAFVEVDMPLDVSCNTLVDYTGDEFLYYEVSIDADESSSIEAAMPVTVCDNVAGVVDTDFVDYSMYIDADVNATVLLYGPLTVSGNSVSNVNDNFVEYDVELTVSESACIEAYMPLTVTCNTLVAGSSMVDADVYVDVWENATALLCNDVVVQDNSMENGYFLPPVAPTGKGYYGYGLKLFQYLSVMADEVMASGVIESEVLFDGNTIVGYDLVGMNVYRNADATAYYADAVACIVGDVTAKNNVLYIDGTGCGLTGGAEVYAYEEWGNATATVDTVFCFTANTMTMQYGHGIVAYSEDDSDDYEAEEGYDHSQVSTNDLKFVIQNNCIYGAEYVIPDLGLKAYDDLYAIYVDVDAYVPVTVSGNTIDLVTGTGVRVVSGDVVVSNNDITIDEGGRGIWVEAEMYGPYSGPWDEDTVVVIENNRIAVGGYGIYVYGAPGVVIRNSQMTNTQGVGLYIEESDDVLVQNVMVTGAETGIYADECFNLTVCDSLFQENDLGGYFEELMNSTVCHTSFLRNNGDGAQFEDCDNLLVECCVFSYNGGDGAYFYNMGLDEPLVIRDCSFEENGDYGLYLSSIYDVTMWNGVFRNNAGYGLYATSTYLVWNIDGAADVKNNDVQLYGAKIYVLCGGTLTLDCIDYFYVSGFDPNDAPVTFQDGMGRLQVNEGGSLVARNVYFSANSFVLWVYGCMNMMDCFIYDIETVYLGPTSQAELTTTTIEDADLNGIYIDDCSPVIRGCVIRYASMDGIYIVGANAKPVITNTVFIENNRGIYAYEACLDKVVDNVFLSNYVAGIYAEKVGGLIHDNVFLFNQKEIFLVDCDVVVAFNEIGYGRLVEMQEPQASLVLTILMDLVSVNYNIGEYSDYDEFDPFDAPDPEDILYEMEWMLRYMLIENIASMFDDHIGIYAVGSCVEARGNVYGMLQYAFYAIGSDVTFSDVVMCNTFDVEYATDNGSRKLSIPMVVYDGIYAVDSTLTIVGACFQVVDDAIFLESSEATISNTVFEAGDFDLYLMDGSVAAVAGELDRYAILDTSMLYWLYELTITVKDQDGWGIADVDLTVTDALGKVWSVGKTNANGVFVASVPAFAETASGVDESVNPFVVNAAYKDQASAEADVTMDGDTQLGMTMTMKKNSFFGMDPLVLGVVALVVIAVIVGALMLARKK